MTHQIAGHITQDEIAAIRNTIEMELYPCQSQERASQLAEIVGTLLAAASMNVDTAPVSTSPLDAEG